MNVLKDDRQSVVCLHGPSVQPPGQRGHVDDGHIALLLENLEKLHVVSDQVMVGVVELSEFLHILVFP